MKTEVIILSLALLIAVPCLASYGEPAEGLLKIDVKAWGGERPAHHGMVFKIYSDANEIPLEVLPSSNPYEISLPLGPRYKVEVYASGMYVDTDFVELSQKNQMIELSMPIPGSTRITTVYADGNTPIEGASVSIRSSDGTYKYWTNSTTDSSGNTIRFWLQPTVSKTDYYVAEVSLGDGLSYVYSPITIGPGLSQDIKIISPWPKIIDQLIIVSVYDSDSEKISGLKEDAVVELYDNNGNEIASSRIDHRGDAHFYNLKVGTYLFRAVNLGQPQEEWGSTKVTMSGKTEPIQIFTNTYEAQNETGFPGKLLETSPVTNSSGILTDSTTEQPSVVPGWIKSVADWWAKGQISDLEFLKAIEYLVNNNVISVQHLQAG